MLINSSDNHTLIMN